MPHAVECLTHLEHYFRSKRENPVETSALFLLPNVKNAAWSKYTKRMAILGTFSKTAPIFERTSIEEVNGITQTPCGYVMYYDAPHMPAGQFCSSTLPEKARIAHIGPDSPTFIFTGKAAGLHSIFLWDSGAALSFINADYVRRHNIHVNPSNERVMLANGQLVTLRGITKIPISIQQYRATLLFHVMEIAEGIDFILGTDWSKANEVLADYAREGSEPSLLIRKGTVRRLFPNRSLPLNPEIADTSACIISAHEAFGILTSETRIGGKQSFLVMVREASMDCSPQTGSRNARLENLLNNYEIVFDVPELGVYRDFTPRCIMTLEGISPPNARAFRLSKAEREEVERQVKELLRKGFIEPSGSPYGSPVLFVPKKDGSLRMCIDYRALNAITVRNKYPLPRIDDLLDQLSGAQYFSSLDLTSGYHQLVLHPDDVEKTAFNSHIGKYQFKVLPFGLTNAPSVFQTAMNTLFSDMLHKGVLVYLDDILVYSKTEDGHYELLERVLQRLKDAGLKAKVSKCHFFKEELNYLGHVVSKYGIKPDSSKVEVIRNWPVPRSIHDVRSFLGLANYFRKFIQGYALLVRPLTDLLKGLDKQERKGKVRRYNAAREEREAIAFAPKWSQACGKQF